MKHRLFLALAALLAAPAVALAQPAATLDTGKVIGIEADGAEQFLGIPYAAPPVGERRWQAPAPLERWTGERNADVMGQPCSAPAGGDGPRFVNEDCLYLNVYRPLGARATTKLPVMVFLHGGAHVQGSPNIYDGARMAQVGKALVVIPAFRIGAFGALALPDAGQESGGFTVQDQAAALQWVQRNAARLGGDPADVTVMGQSAGGSDVCALLASPLGGGLFRQAIMQSGRCDNRTTLEMAQAQARELGAALGCEPAALTACLKAADPGRILDAWKGANAPPFGTAALPNPPLAGVNAGQFHSVPVAIGFTSRERWPYAHSLYPLNEAGYQAKLSATFGARSPAVARLYQSAVYPHVEYAFGAAESDQRSVCPTFPIAQAFGRLVPVALYEFDDNTTPPFKSLGPPQRVPPGYSPGAGHTAELQYLMGYKAAMGPLNTAQRARADTIIRYWVGFNRGAPWPSAADGRMLRFTESGAAGAPVEQVFSGHNCGFWNAG